jgi:1-acyl-sn-glycerol-3-phosphate acyltransferase
MMMIRSSLFNIIFALWTILIGISCLLLLPLENGVFLAGKTWAKGTLFFLRIICGITHEVRGAENIPHRPIIIASKHQSAWETIAFFIFFTRPVYILKRELYLVPVINFYAWAMGAVAINRKSGAKAMRKMLTDTVKTLHKGNSIVIFPEGTRMAPGTAPHYRSGIVGIYKQAGTGVVPVALNSGLYWPKNSFLKKPGKIIVKILPEIKPGLEQSEFMRVLEEKIETASTILIAESL